MKEKISWLIKADNQGDSPSSVLEFMTAEDFAEHWKDAPGLNYEGINMAKPREFYLNQKPFQNHLRLRKCNRCGRTVKNNDRVCTMCKCEEAKENKEKVKQENHQSSGMASPTYHNFEANNEIGGQSTYTGADETYLTTPKPDTAGGWASGGQDGSYIKTGM